MNSFAVWFGRAVWLGVLLVWVVAIPGIFGIDAPLRWLGQPGVEEPLWAAFAWLLLVLLTLFFLPGALDPIRYPASAWLTVISWAAGAIFFLVWYTAEYRAFGVVALILFVVQAPLLFFALRAMPRPAESRSRPATEVTAADIFEYDGSTFHEVKEVAFAGEYERLPYYRGLDLATMLQFFNGSARNLADRRDVRPPFDKLIHTHGICYTGVWRIDQDSPYTGYFARGAEGLVIARVSVAGPRILRGQRRTLGIAGKLFPTTDPHRKVKPANFVTVDGLSGNRAKHVLDAEMTNFPKIGWDPAANFINRVVFRLMDSRPGYRKLYPISALGLSPGDAVNTPDLLMLKVADGTPRVDADDFRDELRLRHYPDHRLVYSILVKNFGDDTWTRLGSLEFTDDAVGEGGDKRLHFWIPLDTPSHN